LDDIPDEVPNELADELLAPSYKAIAIALLENDMHLTSLGYEAKFSKWYDVLKRIEIEARPNNQLMLF
jgi:predicted phosphoadenosine phosphosulfate sulfurtransferase